MSALRIKKLRSIQSIHNYTLELFLLLFISGHYFVFAGATQEQEDDASES